MLTAPGVPCCSRAQEFAEGQRLPEDDRGTGRRVSRAPCAGALSHGTYQVVRCRRLYERCLPFDGSTRACARRTSTEYWRVATKLNHAGFGVETQSQVVVFIAGGQSEDGRAARLLRVLNFSLSLSGSRSGPRQRPLADLLAQPDG